MKSIMSTRGGRRSTTWKPGWKSGKTKVIRIPEVFAPKLYEIARHLDEGDDCLLQDKTTCHVTDNREDAITILKESLLLPANKGGAIKKEIKRVIKLLEK